MPATLCPHGIWSDQKGGHACTWPEGDTVVMAEHSEPEVRRWQAWEDEGWWRIGIDKPQAIASVSIDALDAGFAPSMSGRLVAKLNAHDELVAALRLCRSVIYAGAAFDSRERMAIEKADAALALLGQPRG